MPKSPGAAGYADPSVALWRVVLAGGWLFGEVDDFKGAIADQWRFVSGVHLYQEMFWLKNNSIILVK
jgi:hypothetical protein